MTPPRWSQVCQLVYDEVLIKLLIKLTIKYIYSRPEGRYPGIAGVPSSARGRRRPRRLGQRENRGHCTVAGDHHHHRRRRRRRRRCCDDACSLLLWRLRDIEADDGAHLID